MITAGERVALVSVGGENLVPQAAVLDLVADTTAIAAPASGRRIVVLAGVLGVTATDRVRFRTGSVSGTVVWSAQISANNSPIVMPFGDVPWIVARDGEELRVETVSTSSVVGTLWYITPLSSYVSGP